MPRPMRTAPKDTLILLVGKISSARKEGFVYLDESIVVGYWDSKEGWVINCSQVTGPFIEPSGWLPLPKGIYPKREMDITLTVGKE